MYALTQMPPRLARKDFTVLADQRHRYLACQDMLVTKAQANVFLVQRVSCARPVEPRTWR